MNINLKDISLATIAKNTGDVAEYALEVYKDVLAMNNYVADKVSDLVAVVNEQSSKIDTAAIASRVKSKLPAKYNVQENIETKETPVMKKSCIFGAIAVLAAVAAALVAVALYLKKKEENLAEYEEMLYSEDYLNDYMPQDECDCGCDEEVCCDEECCCEDDEEVQF